MIELTDLQQQALEREHEHPAQVVNPRTQERFLLIPAELYERVRTALEEEDDISSVREMYPLVDKAIEAADSDDADRESA